ncbi:MAG: hypothetical protein M4579_004098 [Chaenotheca gracillima]|nr:MAG: hypothetical protein M4579_004098 [Chaenotheca gracillima]
MSLWQSYSNLKPRTRLVFGLGVIGWAGVGLLLSDQVEKGMGLVATPEDKERLTSALPKITVVEGHHKED